MSAASGSSYARNTLWSSSNGVHHKFSKSKAIVSLGFTLHGPSCTMQATATWLLQTKRHSCYTTLSSQNLPQQLEVDWLYLEILENKKNNLPCKLTKASIKCDYLWICSTLTQWQTPLMHMWHWSQLKEQYWQSVRHKLWWSGEQNHKWENVITYSTGTYSQQSECIDP